MILSASRHTIIATPGQIQIGCQILPCEEWLQKYEAIGSEEEYSDEQVEEYGKLIKLIIERFTL
jgi:hypothetical protein